MNTGKSSRQTRLAKQMEHKRHEDGRQNNLKAQRKACIGTSVNIDLHSTRSTNAMRCSAQRKTACRPSMGCCRCLG